MSRVAFVQDHLVQRGGAERGLLAMLKAAPGAEVVTAVHRPGKCYPEFDHMPIRILPVGKIPGLRDRHRALLPLLPAAFSAATVDADVVICGTSGWAQGVRTEGRKVIYSYALTRWLYERDAYLRTSSRLVSAATTGLGPLLAAWDRRTMASGDRYVTEGTVMKRRLREIYGVEAEIVPLPNTIDVTGEQRAVDGLDADFFVCAARLMPYKNVDVLVEAFRGLPDEQLVVAGDGPMMASLVARAPQNVVMMGTADDVELRWLYERCAAVISAAHEPFGMTPVEGAAFGKPSVAIYDGGFVDTIVPDVTGLHFHARDPNAVIDSVRAFRRAVFQRASILEHARQYDESVFVERIRRIIDEEAAIGNGSARSG